MDSEPREVWGDLVTTAFVEASLLFKSLDPDARADLLKLARLRTFAAGEAVSADPDGFYLVRDGTAAVVAPGAAGPVEIAVLERGAFFGEAKVLGCCEVPGALSARSEAAVVEFPAPVVAALAERFPRVRKLLEAVHAARQKEAAARLGVA